MAPLFSSPLAAELPEFNPEEAPGAMDMDDGNSDQDTPQQQIVKEELPASHDYKESAMGKPDSLAEAFDYFNFPVEYHVKLSLSERHVDSEVFSSNCYANANT